MKKSGAGRGGGKIGRRRMPLKKAPETAPITGAVIYIHMSSKAHETIAGPNDLAGFIDPPEMGLDWPKTHPTTKVNIL